MTNIKDINIEVGDIVTAIERRFRARQVGGKHDIEFYTDPSNITEQIHHVYLIKDIDRREVYFVRLYSSPPVSKTKGTWWGAELVCDLLGGMVDDINKVGVYNGRSCYDFGYDRLVKKNGV